MEELVPRRTECLDSSHITSLITPATTKLFGRVHALDVIEKANLAITLTNGEPAGQVVAHAALYDYPNISEIDPTTWEVWLTTNYDVTMPTVMNSLFLHLFVSSDTINRESAAEEIFRTSFTALVPLQYVWLVTSPGVKLDVALQRLFSPVNPAEGATPTHMVYVTCRHQHFPMLHIRNSKVEDHDDLTPVFNQCASKLEQQYGDYFIAELIEAQDDTHRTIVADVNGRAVGFISLTTEVDLDLLNSCFDLAPYHGLCKPSDDDEVVSIEGIISQPVSAVSLLSDAVHAEASQTVMASAPVAITSHLLQNSSSKQSDAVGHVSSSQTEVIVKASSSSIAIDHQTVLMQSSLTDQSNTPSGISSKSSNQQAILSDEQVSKSSATPLEQTASKETTESHDLPAPHPLGAAAREHRCVYRGDSNVVCVQLFCMDESYEMRSHDLLPGIFQCFPDKDIVALMQPHDQAEFPLLTNFTRVTPRPNSVLSQELFVFHKCALIESVMVRLAKTSDIEQIEVLSQGIDGSDHLINDVKQYLTARRDPTKQGATPLCCVVAECIGQVVGVCVLRQEEAIQYIRAHYNIEDFVYFSCHRPEQQGHLFHLLLSPVFSSHCKYFIKEVLRHAHMTCLYYPLYQPGMSPKPHLLPSHLSAFVSVRPRRQIEYPNEGLDVNAPTSEVLKKMEPFALYHTSRKLSMEPKVMVNHRIVVVGASDTSVAFLEALVFCPHLQFNNLLLVSPNGLVAPSLHDHFLPHTYCHYNDSYYHQSLHTWINVVHGSMTKIDREDKCIMVNDQDRSVLIHYDQLLICIGTQFKIDGPALPPKSVVTINNSVQAGCVANWASNHPTGDIVVYGSSLEAFTAIEGLLRVGVATERIAMVQPHPPVHFCNFLVEDRVTKSLSNLGVRILVGYDITDYVLEGKTLKGVKLSSKEETLQISCSLVVCLHQKHVDPQAFRAMNHACLVFDNRLVVDTCYHTNDPNIFAAGPVTKYSRRYHTEWSHADYNAKEVGQKLAMTILTMFDPSLTPCDDQPVLPSFTMAKAQGGLHYLHLSKPHPGNQPITDPRDHVLVTDTEDNGYFSITINQYYNVDSITCLSNKPLEVSNYLSLYGVNEKCINNLLSRHQEELIPDLYNYLREPWAMAIYHDRFVDFQQEVTELLRTPLDNNNPSLEETIQQVAMDADYRVSDDQRQNMLQLFMASSAKNALEQKLLGYLNHNHYHLPMYARPQLL
ncbi:cilia- and flagella-associated protein 61-like isoform X2 [Dysidea avara]|uniref:cilia- and flagella-associated protein 61-like isoform X2 n=1 Tax=Dysidea avara TaxID=196820 RepID=UPI0033320257